MELHNLDHLRTHGEEALEISLPLPILAPSPLAGEGRGEGSLPWDVLMLSFPMFQTLSFLTFQALSFPTLLIGNPMPG